MTILSSIRDRLSRPSSSASSAHAPGEAAGDGDAPPFAGYDRLDDREVREGLSDHSQVELEGVESYERSHKNRLSVLDKLRFMRGREPLPGYDALSVDEILAALKEADLATVKRVRDYERKFANRPDVLEEVVRVHHQRRAARPATAAPSYQPMSATSASSAPVDRPEGNGSP
jgi:hypothetical protein